MSALGAVYGGVARLRRSWYDRRPASRIRLSRPVISVGNLVTGGSGKTPVVAAVAAVGCWTAGTNGPQKRTASPYRRNANHT